jgi:hypothetical protein
MLKAISFLKESKVIKFKREAYAVMNLDEIRVYKIEHPDNSKQGHHFSVEHIRLFCEFYKINSNYIYGFESEIFRKKDDVAVF